MTQEGNSYPDIMMLAPIARLLGISLDTLLSFKENLSEEEITQMVREADQRFEQGTYEETFEWMKEKIKCYPNCKRLIWQFAVILDAQRSVKEVQDAEKYDSYILDCYERGLDSEEEELRTYAADSLFGYYVRKEEYEKAEEYLKYYSKQNPERKRKQAVIFSKTGRSEEAYKAYEEILFSGYQMLNLVLNSIYMLAMQEENRKKAHQMMDKHQELARVFEMGTYHEVSGKLELAVVEQDADTVVETVEKMLDSVTEMMSFMESELYEHMTFRKVDPAFTAEVKKNLLECFQDEETYGFLKEDERWKKLVEQEEYDCKNF